MALTVSSFHDRPRALLPFTGGNDPDDPEYQVTHNASAGHHVIQWRTTILWVCSSLAVLLMVWLWWKQRRSVTGRRRPPPPQHDTEPEEIHTAERRDASMDAIHRALQRQTLETDDDVRTLLWRMSPLYEPTTKNTAHSAVALPWTTTPRDHSSTTGSVSSTTTTITATSRSSDLDDTEHTTTTAAAIANATGQDPQRSESNGCPICLDPFRPTETVAWSTHPDCCQRVFHYTCLQQWLLLGVQPPPPEQPQPRQNAHCPCCRCRILEHVDAVDDNDATEV